MLRSDIPFFESSCLRINKPSISANDGGHGHAAVKDVKRKKDRMK